MHFVTSSFWLMLSFLTEILDQAYTHPFKRSNTKHALQFIPGS